MALSWELLPGMDVALVLMDDEEFGREIKWFFSPAVRERVDFKFLVVFVEKSMDLLLACLADPSPASALAGGRRCLVDGADEPAVLIRSKLFCYSFPSKGLVPEELRHRGRELGSALSGPLGNLAVRDADLEAQAERAGLEPVMCLDVIAGVRGCLAIDGDGLVLTLDNPEALSSAIAEEILSIARVQLQVISDMVGPFDKLRATE
jgi:hypothetical protein